MLVSLRRSKVIVWLLVAAMFVSMLLPPMAANYANAAGANPEGYVTMSVEKFTLGQGYRIEPVKVPFYEGDNGAALLTHLLGEGNYKSSGSIDTYFYLSKVKDSDTSEVNIPQYITQYILDYGEKIETRAEEEWLGEFDYTSMSGWMYAVNNEFPPVGFSDYYPEDGDVIRTQFTVYGWGADLGGGWDVNFIEPADKDALTAQIGEINSATNKAGLLSDEAVKIAYDHAYAVLTDMESDQDSVDRAGTDLNYAVTNARAKEQLSQNLAHIVKTVDNPTFDSLGGDWSVLSLARANYTVPDHYYETYYNNAVSKVIELMPKYSNKLDRNKGTEHSRLILGFTSIGESITNVAGYDIRNALADYNFVIRQGINGPIFALIALNTKNYEIPTVEGISDQTTREKLIQYILDKEIKKGTADAGGWALSGDNPDPDITGMALQALAPYYKTDAQVTAAVERAIDWLSRAQTADGGYASWGSVNAESIAQVVVALTELSIDPLKDARFVKNGKSAVEALLSFAVPEGGFMHIKPGTAGNGGAGAGVVDGMATDQGTYALVAYDRFVNGNNRLYDMTDVQEAAPGEPKEIVLSLPSGNKPELVIPNGRDHFVIPVTAADSEKEINVNISADKRSEVSVNLPLNTGLPQLKAAKGNASLVIPKGTQVVGGDGAAIELFTFRDAAATALKDSINSIMAKDHKLDSIVHAFSMGGAGKVEFSDFVTLTFAGMSGKSAAYIEDGVPHQIQKYADDQKGVAGGKDEYAYDSGADLIVKTKHFTDFIAYSVSLIETPGGGGGTSPQPKLSVTLSVDKLTINKGYVVDATSVELQAGDTVWTVLKRVLDNRSIGYEYSWSEKYGSVYVESIAGDGEFDHGSGSGWMYNVGGKYPNYGASRYTLKGGERIEWRYTTNLGIDLGVDPSEWDDPVNPENPNNGGDKEGDSPSGGQGNAAGTDGNASETDTPNNPGGEAEAITDLKKRYSDADTISSWAYQAIGEATQYGFIQGSNGKFRPKSSITRAEFTKILAAVMELDLEVGQSIAFKDVARDDWFYPYVNAAFREGLVTGYNGKFNPQDPITREQMAAMIIRALGAKSVKPTAAIQDIDQVSAWARTDVETAVALQIMTGSYNKFNPQQWVTREMAAVVAVRAYDYKQEHDAEAEPTDQTEQAAADIKRQIEETAAFLQQAVQEPEINSIGGEWTILGLARSGVKVPESYYAKYYVNAEKTLKEKEGKLHSVKYTEYDRVILALTSLGKPVDDVAGYNLREPLADFDTLTKQGINGPIFALIALDSNHYDIPLVEGVKTQTTRELLIDFILGREIGGGGWALGANPAEPDPDITSMAIQGLTPYYESNAEVRAAVDRGVKWLSGNQSGDGGFASWDSLNSESVAQVIVALTGLGIDPHNDVRFVKQGHSAVDALLGFAASGGGFYHVKPGGIDNGGAKPGEVDLMATDQAFYALVAYNRFVHGQTRLYDMTDVQPK